MPGRVLVVVDTEQDSDQVAMQRGVWLAESLETGVELFSSVFESLSYGDIYPDPLTFDQVKEWIIDQRRQLLEKLAKPYQDQGYDIKISVVWDRPAYQAVVRHVIQSAPSMVVKETHFHQAIYRALFSHSDWGLIRSCPTPLMLCRQGNELNGPILASVDPTHTNDRPLALDQVIMDQAVWLSDKVGSELHVFHSYPQAMAIPAYTPEGKVARSQYVEETHRTSVSHLLDKYTVDANSVHIKCGAPAELLPGVVDEINASCVVIGSVNRNLPQRMVLGSTAERVLDRISCDLMILKPPFFDTRVSNKSIRW